MVQKLSTTTSTESISFAPDSLAKRPALAGMAMQVIGTWSHCDALRAAMLTTMLRVDFKVATQMFLAVHSPDIQSRLITAAANEALKGDADALALFRATNGCSKAAYRHRNNFAHGIWGITPELPDALIWLPAKQYTEIHLYWAEFRAGLVERKRANDAIDRDEFGVYREPDLAAEIQIVADTLARLRTLHNVLVKIGQGEPSEKWRNALRSDPQIASALAKPEKN